MAYAVTASGDEPLSGVVPGNRRRVSAKLAGDSAYTTAVGGTALPPSLFGLTKIDAASVGLSEDGTQIAVYLASTGNIKLYSTAAAPVVEVGTGNQSAKVFPITVWGI
jgi:hypothetical protein